MLKRRHKVLITPSRCDRNFMSFVLLRNLHNTRKSKAEQDTPFVVGRSANVANVTTALCRLSNGIKLPQFPQRHITTAGIVLHADGQMIKKPQNNPLKPLFSKITKNVSQKTPSFFSLKQLLSYVCLQSYVTHNGIRFMPL